MAIYTEAEARNKRAFDDCGIACASVDMPIKETYSYDELFEAVRRYRDNGYRLCIASRCIAWVWDDQEFERYSKAFGSYAAEWRQYAPGAAYEQSECEKPEGAGIFWQKHKPYMPDDPAGWWARPNLNRRGHCGRVLLTTILEAP